MKIFNRGKPVRKEGIFPFFSSIFKSREQSLFESTMSREGMAVGSINDLHSSGKTRRFRNMFQDREIYSMTMKEIERLRPQYGGMEAAVSGDGLMVVNNYSMNDFNTLLLTIHSGKWIPEESGRKLKVPEEKMGEIYDTDCDRIYSPLVLRRNGIWVNTFLSRFVCDLNRPEGSCIYSEGSEKWLEGRVWSGRGPGSGERSSIRSWYRRFYSLLEDILESYSFNIIFDGHTMKDSPGRPQVSFGTRFVPGFYMPIVKDMQKRLPLLGYPETEFNMPYKGGYLVEWLRSRYPYRFIFSMEINKKVYMRGVRTDPSGVSKISEALLKIFSI